MLIKRNIKLNLPTRKKIQFLSCDVISENDKFFLAFTCEKEHHLLNGDNVVLTRQAFVCDTYKEALAMATEENKGWLIVVRDNSGTNVSTIVEPENGVFTLEEETVLRYGVEYMPVKEATDGNINTYYNIKIGDKFYPSGLYVVGCSGVMNRVEGGQAVYCIFGEGKLKEVSDETAQKIIQQHGLDGADNIKVLQNETFSNKCFTLSFPMYRGVDIDRIYEGYLLLRRPLPFSLVKGAEFSLCYKERDLYGGFKKDDRDNTVMNEIKCVVNDPYSFTVLDETEIDPNETYYIKDSRFINDSSDLIDGVSLYEGSATFSVPVPLSNKTNPEMNDEEYIKYMFDEKKRELVPGIADFEKKCFTPYYVNGSVKSNVKEIRVNLFLRDRYDYTQGVNKGTGYNILSDNWVTDDAKGWFQCPLDNNGNPDTSKYTGMPDLLGCFGFTDDDVYYRKKKLGKSFLRFSFYDSPNPSEQMLLYYSTVFFDTGDAYERYINGIEAKNNNTNVSLVQNETTDERKRISAGFIIHDKYDRNRSSEGFYLYLFPDKISDGEERTIYLKIDFNHAGNGKTIPLMLPNDGARQLNPTMSGFPLSFSEKSSENGVSLNLQKFYKNQYIPVKLKYDTTLRDYVYYIPYASFDINEQSITLNMFEPRLNDVY
jgi:hypothetical protein